MPISGRVSILSIALALAVVGVMIWGGLQHPDPLARFIHTDAMRHILGFSVLGVGAALLPNALGRTAALAGTLAFALAFEIMQGPFSPREASYRDLLNSCVGAFAGFGLGAAGMTARAALLDLFGGRVSRQN